MDTFPETYDLSDKEYEKAEKGSLQTFLDALFEHHGPDFATFSFSINAIDPLAFLELNWDKDEFQYYWEKPSEEFAIAAGGEVLSLSASGSSRFKAVSREIQSVIHTTSEYSGVPHIYSGLMFLGGFSFFDNIQNKLWRDFESASFTVPKWAVIKDGKFNIATIAVDLSQFDDAQSLHQYLIETYKQISDTCDIDVEDINGRTQKSSPAELKPLLESESERTDWIKAVEESKKLIQENTFEKIVLARQLSVDVDTPPVATEIMNRLRNRYPGCYNFLVHNPENKTFMGSSPERLVSFRNRLLLTEALAGSIQRGDTATEDTVLEKSLTESRKNKEEHNFVIRDIEERLDDYADFLDRRSTPEIKKLSNVQHLYTPIRAQIQKDIDMLEVLGELHPTPAVGGYPWHQAAPYLHSLENFDRGWYAGPVGWINSKEVGEFAVGIRSGLLTENRVHFYAGCGIVADSDPAEEWEETNLKLKPMLSALHYG